MTENNECEYCSNYIYDDEIEGFECQVYLDEDEMVRCFSQEQKCCRYYQTKDDYKIVRRQNE